MTKSEYEAIKRRTEMGTSTREGEPRIVIICVDVFGNPLDPNQLGAETGVRFKERAEAFAQAAKDRRALVEFIERGFDIEWPEDKTAEIADRSDHSDT